MTKRLLVVGDDARALGILEDHLSPLGHDLVLAADGRAALGLFVDRQPDLVLIDAPMPSFDGVDLLTHLRAHSGTDYLPVILVAPHSESEHRRRGLDSGADEIIEMPVDGAILVARVRTLLALKESRDALTARSEALERLQRKQQELIAFITHDLRNPLAVAMTNILWVKENLRQTSLAEGLGEAYGAVRQLQGMVDDLRVVSHIEQLPFQVRPEAIAVGDLLTDVVRTYQRAADEKHVALLTPDAAGLHIRTDRTLLRRVLENIVENSLRYTPSDGRVAVAACARRDVEIAISNTGPSIPRCDHDRIFEKFQRGERETSSRGTAGLGLYFCKCAVEVLGGQIEIVESAEWPTSFVVHLPQEQRLAP